MTLYQFQVNQKNQRTQEMGAIYSDSLKLLGGKDVAPSAKAGAIYALQAPLEYDETYHKTVIAVLLTYIKTARSTQTHPGFTSSTPSM